MADAADLKIIADRNVDHFEDWPFLDEDWTGSSFEMQIRVARDTTGTPLLDATTTGGSFSLPFAGTATVAAHIAAGRLNSGIYADINPFTGSRYVAGDNVLLSQLHMQLASAGFLATFPFPPERGDDFGGWYDIIRTPASGSAEIVLRGPFIVRAGVTIP